QAQTVETDFPHHQPRQARLRNAQPGEGRQLQGDGNHLHAKVSLGNDDMITSIHTLIYSDDANATRAFLRDVLGWKYVAEDFDNDWLIFRSGPSEMGVHPTHSEWEGQTYDHPRHHSIALMCDDIETTVGELRAKGAQFRGPIEQREYGRVIMVVVPGAD